MTEQTDRAALRLGPRALYPAKAALTRARAAAWHLRRRPAAPGVRILYYHRISNDRDELAVSPKRFREQMEWLARTGYRGVDTIAALDASGPVVGLNFDDGYADVAEHALPVLRELGFHATVFVATGVTSGTARFSWYGARQPPLLTWEEIRTLDGEGPFRFEPHTITHRNLLELSDEEADREIVGSAEELTERLGRAARVFCYPAGLYGERERRIVRGHGLLAAVSCEPGVNDSRTDRFALRRIQVDHRDSLFDFRAKVTGGFDEPPPLRSAYRRLRYGMGRPRAASSSE